MAILSIDSRSISHLESQDFMVLLDKFKVETEFFQFVASHLYEIYPTLLKYAEYTPLDLIGEPLWADLTGLAQRQAIFCLKHLATLPDSPLIDVSSPGCGLTTFEIAFTSTQTLS